MVGHADIGAEQGHKRARQTLGLPPGLTKGQAQQVTGLDHHLRVAAGAATPTSMGRTPGRQRPRA